jgi:hypothetical protein
MKTLVIPDVHLKIAKLKAILDKHKDQDETIFLGDWFDSFPSKQASLPDTIEWLNENVTNPAYRFLFGNHDLQYAYPDIDGLKCSGWTWSNDMQIRTGLTPVVFDSFSFIEVAHGWAISHAGIHPSMMPPHNEPTEDLVHRIEYRAFAALGRGGVYPAIGAGRGRGGNQAVGGVTWLDWDREFEAIPGVNQIVGHSHGKEPRAIRTKDSENWCIDTGLKHIAVIEDGIVTIEMVQ